MLDCSIHEPKSLATIIAEESVILNENIGDVMRRHGVHPMGPLRPIVASEVERLKSINYCQRVYPARWKAMQRQLELRKKEDG